MKQTAVEFIKQKLLCDEYWYENMTFKQIFEQAKELEKEQIIDAFEAAEKDCGRDFLHGDLYYNETFKSE